MSKTVKELAADLDAFKQEVGNVQVSVHTCWHWEQVAAVLEENSRYGELVKMEITQHHKAVSDDQFDVIVWHLPLLNPESRRELKMKGYYAGLKASKHRYAVEIVNDKPD